jgi:branched-chain amino acid transport system permease protein
MYILVALGLTLVFSIMGIMNLAHGEIYMMGGYVTYYLWVILGMHVLIALPICILIMGGFGIILEKFLFRPVRIDFERGIVVAVALILLLRTAAEITVGTFPKGLPAIFPGTLTLFGMTFSWGRIGSAGISIALLAALYAFIQHSKLGQAMLAVSQDLDGAALQGINVNRVSSAAMVIGSALAAAAGALMASVFALEPEMGTFALTKGFAVIVLGGLGSIVGAVIGGLLMGMIDGIAPIFMGSHLAGAIGFGVIIVVLIIKPTGLFGHEV